MVGARRNSPSQDGRGVGKAGLSSPSTNSSAIFLTLGFAGPRTVRTVLHAATQPKAVIIQIWPALVHRRSMYLKAPE